MSYDRRMRTRLTDILEIEHPVMLAGMGGVSYSGLVAAVSEAGGFGCMGASTMGLDKMVDEIAKVRTLTDKPFGVDLLTAAPGDMEAQVKAIIDGGGRVFVAGLGVPRDVIELCHSKNVLVVNMCGKVRHAVAAVEAGCDIVVAQGTEAGGHTGQVATMALVPQVVDAVGDRVPVVAAGGLFDGRGLAAALALGADGVWMGTRFIATPEARAVPGYKDALLRIGEDGTVDHPGLHRQDLPGGAQRLHPVLGGAHRRAPAVPGPVHALDERRRQPPRRWTTRPPDIDPDREFWPAGQGAGAIHELVPAGELVRQIVAEAEAVLGRVSTLT